MPHEQPGVILSDITHTSKERHADDSVDVNNEYEVLDKYSQAYEEIQVSQAPPPKQEQQQSSSAGDYELTQCTAYVPVTHGNQLTETSLMQPTTVCCTDHEVAATAGAKDQGKGGTDDDQKDKDNGTYETVHPN